MGGVVSRDYTPREELVASDVVVARELHWHQLKFDDPHGFPGFEVAEEIVDIADILVGHGVTDVAAEFVNLGVRGLSPSAGGSR